MKKLITFVCAVAMVIALFPSGSMTARAAQASGVCGEDLTWEFSDDKLTISGTGEMYDYSEESPAPWHDLQYISELWIEEGVTTIGDYAFAGAWQARRMVIPNSIISIGTKAFSDITRYSAIMCFLGEKPTIAPDAFSGSVLRCVTVLEWAKNETELYGAKSTHWQPAKVVIMRDTTRLWSRNAQMKPEDFIFAVAAYASEMHFLYTPANVTFGPYDNSSYGQKSVEITADGHAFIYDYFVTDGTNHLDLVKVEFPELKERTGYEHPLLPTVTIGTLPLEYNYDYDLEHTNKIIVGMDGEFVLTGKGVIEGYEKTFYYPILKTDISEAQVNVTAWQEFTGLPIVPNVFVTRAGTSLTQNTNYEVFLENNVNLGYADVRVIGKGDCYGETTGRFSIETMDTHTRLDGKYLGKADEELSDNIQITEMYISPNWLYTHLNTSSKHVAYYMLYKFDGEEFVLVDEYETKYGYFSDTAFEYDFSSVYEDDAEEGGAIYMLSYSWATANNDVFGGALLLAIPAKVADASSMTLHYVEGDGDFRKEYLSVSGDDGVLGDILWTSSDESVATVEKGTVTLHQPGTALITARYADLIQTHMVTVEALDLTEGIIFDYSPDKGAWVIWGDRLLLEGVDYSLSTVKTANGTKVIVTGCGLFTGELEKTFEGVDSLADPHTHGFTNSCDSTCSGCIYTRDNDHSFGAQWSKDDIAHWHECNTCSEQKDYAEHTFADGRTDECTVCGRLWKPGDIDGNGIVNRDDVIALLLHVTMPAAFPINIPADYNADGLVTRDDVIQLLLHVTMPDAFPL